MSAKYAEQERSAFERFCASLSDTVIHRQSLPDGTNVAVVRLIFHVALYVNPTSSDCLSIDYDARYCYAHLDAALAGINFFFHSGLWVYWKKNHSEKITVLDGYLYKDGAYQIPENSIGMAGWSEKEAHAGIYRYYEVEIGPALDKVWVHSSDGSTVGRFGLYGIDMHNTVEEQMAGAPECRLCTHEPVTETCWEQFRALAKEWWYVDIPQDAFNVQLFADRKIKSA